MEKKEKKEKVDVIVKRIISGYKEVNSNLNQVMSDLHYLEKTNRYREYGGYQKQEFKVFLWEVCHIPYNRYRELWSAFQFFPKESEMFGPHVVQTVKQAVGAGKTPKVLKEIKGEYDRIKKIPTRQFINQTIEKYAPPQKGKDTDDTKAYWRDRALSFEKKWKAAEKELADLRVQLERNKPFVEAYLTARPIFQEGPRLSA